MFFFCFQPSHSSDQGENFPVVPKKRSDRADRILSTDSKNLAVHLAFVANCVEAISRAEPWVVDSVYVSGRVAFGQEPEMAMKRRNRDVLNKLGDVNKVISPALYL